MYTHAVVMVECKMFVVILQMMMTCVLLLEELVAMTRRLYS